ncbi:Flp pilus assembly protein CpaB [Shewanella yunxiaonensis]|uniref:Flp pilus assembly protein CpaB n=1 Tax=Shewanella yunxiaonensis TaxID=2829809 RepID=A0ABX7YX89_9GAMM|nr:Flp pilus assembly protein CpaB [Shewanella yunxiaonensis]QUN06946.1 Flp pilus assembly protein CpaB [Shewanella yunxiaonensis]
MNNKTILFVVLSLVFGVFAVYLANTWLNSNTKQNTAAETHTVVTMATQVPMGTILERKHMMLTSVPESMIPKGSILKLEDAEGMVVNQKLYQGEVLRAERLTKKGEGSTLSSLITPQMRAVTIRVNDVVGVAGFLLPGNRVDVINLYKQGSLKTDVVLANVKILAIDQRSSNDENKPVLVRAVTLELSLEQAEVLMIAEGRGSLQLALRNPNDEAQVEIADINKAPTAEVSAESKPAPMPVDRVVYVPTPKRNGKVFILKGISEQEVKVQN